MLQPFFCVFFVLLLLLSKIFGALHFTKQQLPFVVFYVKNLEICLCFQKCSVCKPSLQWGYITGLVAGVYSGMTYGMQEARGVHELGNGIYAMQEARGVHGWVRK